MRRPPPPPYRSRGARRFAGAGLAVLLLAGSSLALSPGASAEEEGGPTEPPFGDRIEPGTSFVDTTEVTTGTYTLNVPAPNEDHYFEVPRSEPGEAIWYGITSQVSTSPENATLAVEGTAEGDSTRSCGEGQIFGDPVSVLTSLISSNRSAECREADSITITVTNIELADETVPTEDFYQLVIWTEPPVESTDQLPGPNENSPWTPMRPADGAPQEVPGASTFTEAEPLADGTYRTTVQRGRTAIFASPLTYGQHAQVEAIVTDGQIESEFSELDAIWLSPLGGRLRTVTPNGGPPPGLVVNGETPAGWATPIVTYQNRQATGGVGSSRGGGFASEIAAPAGFPGTYFLALEIPDGEFTQDNYPDEMTIDMNVATITDYEGSEPEYVTEPPPLSALDGSGFVATAEEEQAARADDAEPAPWPLVAGLFAGAALLAAVGGVAVGRVRRSRT